MLNTKDLNDFFKILGDETRLRIIIALLEQPKNVSELVNCLCLSQSLISHQLRILKNSNIVRSKKNGRYTTYELCDQHIQNILLLSQNHIDGC